MKTSRRSLLWGALGVAGASVVGCSGDPAPPSPTPSPSPTAPAPSPSAVASPSPSPSPTPTGVPAPLTGLLVPEALTHPAVALKVPNLRQENPQIGLMEADIVFCQPNGDAYTRFCAVYHSKFAPAVNPIRSMRPVDVPLLSPIGPVFGNTGAAGWVTNYVEAHSEHLESRPYLENRGTGAYSVDRARIYKAGGKPQYDRAIVAHPAELARIAQRMTAPPAPYFPWAASPADASTASGKPAQRIAVPYTRRHKYDMTYAFDAARGTYLRSQPWGPHELADGTRVAVDQVLVIEARWRMDKIWKGSGAADPVVGIIKAEGAFHYFQGGRYVQGTWAKGEIHEPFAFTTADGKPLRMAPGRTWVELPQKGADVLVS